MNIYDTKLVFCIKCDRPIGEIYYNAKVIDPMCGQCDNSIPNVKDQWSSRIKISSTKKLQSQIHFNDMMN